MAAIHVACSLLVCLVLSSLCEAQTPQFASGVVPQQSGQPMVAPYTLTQAGQNPQTSQSLPFRFQSMVPKAQAGYPVTTLVQPQPQTGQQMPGARSPLNTQPGLTPQMATSPQFPFQFQSRTPVSSGQPQVRQPFLTQPMVPFLQQMSQTLPAQFGNQGRMPVQMVPQQPSQPFSRVPSQPRFVSPAQNPFSNQMRLPFQNPAQGQMRPPFTNLFQSMFQPGQVGVLPTQPQVQFPSQLNPQFGNQVRPQYTVPTQNRGQPSVPGQVFGQPQFLNPNQMRPTFPNTNQMRPVYPNTNQVRPNFPNMNQMRPTFPNTNQMRPVYPNQIAPQPQRPSPVPMRPPQNQGQMPNQVRPTFPGQMGQQQFPFQTVPQVPSQGQGQFNNQVRPGLPNPQPRPNPQEGPRERAARETRNLILGNRNVARQVKNAVSAKTKDASFLRCPMVMNPKLPPPNMANDALAQACLTPKTCLTMTRERQALCASQPNTCQLTMRLVQLCPLLRLAPGQQGRFSGSRPNPPSGTGQGVTTRRPLDAVLQRLINALRANGGRFSGSTAQPTSAQTGSTSQSGGPTTQSGVASTSSGAATTGGGASTAPGGATTPGGGATNAGGGATTPGGGVTTAGGGVTGSTGTAVSTNPASTPPSSG